MFSRDININFLPIEILLNVFSYLTPEDIFSAASVTTKFKIMAKNNLFWKQKFEKHFPQAISSLLTEANLNWYEEFLKNYEKDYKDLPVNIRKLFSLVKEGDFNRLKEMDIQLLDLDNKDQNGITLLDWVLKKSNQALLDCFYRVVQKEYTTNNTTVDVSKTDKYERTILYWAVIFNQPCDYIYALFCQGSRYDEKYFNKFLPIHIAAKEGRFEIVRLFIESKPDLLNQEDARGQTPLMWAASKGHPVVVKYFLQQPGINISAASHGFNDHHDGYTAMHWAAKNGHKDVIAILLGNILAKAMANIAIPYMQFLPIHIAAKEGRLEIVRLFIESKPDLLNQEDARGQTPLMWAASKGHPVVVKYFLQQPGINISAASHGFNDHHDGNTALHWAAKNGHNEVIINLLEYKVPNLSKKVDISTLEHSQIKAKIKLLNYLFERPQQDIYKSSFSLFGQTFNYGISRQEKIDAANTLKKVIFLGSDKADLDNHKDAISDGELGSIYSGLEIK